MAKDATRQMRVERPDIDRQLRMLRRDERNNIEHQHGLTLRLSPQLEDQTGTITVGPDPRRIRQRPTPRQQPFAIRPFAENDGLSRLHRMIEVSKGQRAQMETETACVGTHTQIDWPRGSIETEIEDGATSLVSNRRRQTENEPTFEVVIAKDPTSQMRVERPDIDRQLRMLRRDERNNVEHQHGLTLRLSLQLEDQTGTITVGPDPRRIRQGPALRQEPFAVRPFAEHDGLSRLHRMVDRLQGSTSADADPTAARPMTSRLPAASAARRP